MTGCNSKKEATLSTDGRTQANTAASKATPDVVSITDQLIEVSCGQCQFGMEGTGCDLAVRIDGRSYYVDGTAIDDHGDAHADDGLCNCIRRAKATGTIKNGRFVSDRLEVVPLSSPKNN